VRLHPSCTPIATTRVVSNDIAHGDLTLPLGIELGGWVNGRRRGGGVPLGGFSVPAVDAGADTHNLGVDGCRNAVVHLAVDLGQCVGCTQSWD